MLEAAQTARMTAFVSAVFDCHPFMNMPDCICCVYRSYFLAFPGCMEMGGNGYALLADRRRIERINLKPLIYYSYCA